MKERRENQKNLKRLSMGTRVRKVCFLIHSFNFSSLHVFGFFFLSSRTHAFQTCPKTLPQPVKCLQKKKELAAANSKPTGDGGENPRFEIYIMGPQQGQVMQFQIHGRHPVCKVLHVACKAFGPEYDRYGFHWRRIFEADFIFEQGLSHALCDH